MATGNVNLLALHLSSTYDIKFIHCSSRIVFIFCIYLLLKIENLDGDLITIFPEGCILTFSVPIYIY